MPVSDQTQRHRDTEKKDAAAAADKAKARKKPAKKAAAKSKAKKPADDEAAAGSAPEADKEGD
jgi:hypothetical protein